MKNTNTPNTNTATPAAEPRLRKILVRPDRDDQPDFPLHMPLRLSAGMAQHYGVLQDVTLVVDYPEEDPNVAPEEQKGIMRVEFKRADGTPSELTRLYSYRAWPYALPVARVNPERIAMSILDDWRGMHLVRKN